LGIRFRVTRKSLKEPISEVITLFWLTSPFVISDLFMCLSLRWIVEWNLKLAWKLVHVWFSFGRDKSDFRMIES
jgi:hypothetical protein